jgi:virginiamycin B lyase
MLDRTARVPSSALVALSFTFAAMRVQAAVEPLDPVPMQEWKVPYGGHPRDPFAASSDEIWFVGQEGHYLGRFTPSTGKFEKRDLPDEPGPHNVIVGSDGIVWYSGNLKGYIGRYDPKSDAITKFEMPDQAVSDPHTLVFDDGERHIWFTAQQGNVVGRLRLADSRLDLIPVPTANARPYGIRIAPDGTPWIVLFGTNRLASVDPKTLAIQEYVIPDEKARPRRLEITEDGRVWYADYLRGALGVYDPQKKTFHEFALPSGGKSAPYGMALDDFGRIWVVETGVQPNLFVGFDTVKERVVSIRPIRSGGETVRHMYYDSAADAVWFGTDAGTIGRAGVAPKPD